jgi:hypothetical protein
MDWMYVVLSVAWVAWVLWCAVIAWRWLGRRRDQPECPHSDSVRLLERDGTPSGVVLCLMCDEQLLAPTNGASSSRATGTSGDGQSGRRTS